jgi:hypothetical protein
MCGNPFEQTESAVLRAENVRLQTELNNTGEWLAENVRLRHEIVELRACIKEYLDKNHWQYRADSDYSPTGDVYLCELCGKESPDGFDEIVHAADCLVLRMRFSLIEAAVSAAESEGE